ncbi:sugar nucleotide-binding protein [Clostridium beijerinckii]|uniref:sugar nucleotide-binding protein n=1 Tax=Clostridium beijerinckii TaxID=1520 RepID=UPI001361EB60|nr:sugar nucleotide-binding protein [Clostridium beijerinckii]MZK49006.1 sugar nucleotide-binding protein [Clostridium beijerinckii]MZK57381.1 sugar nucleotide-binding protein [Clostridium beijerinckii]MZK67592.1 sugar nucleotide-binding protein [Clostridium beijerinckii]MZK72677.1 sugar nucleotide-binding protein [Clostridium beijerinckii]MZK82273.1 sugar nucleotide-binding protein [Clostridium beijerinckii]
MNKILVLGGSGLLGTAIINQMNNYSNFDVYSTYFQNPMLFNQHKSFKLDICELDNINNILNNLKPDIIVSCLRGDFNKQLIAHIKIAEYLKHNGGNLYFFSTANVFDNDLSKPYYEDDFPNSHTDYGKYKIKCENTIKEILQDSACILRIPQIWGKNSPRMKQLLKSLNSNEDIVVYPKLFHNTNTDIMVARQLCYIINNNLKGTFHLTSEDVVNYKDFYNELIKGLGGNNSRIQENFEEKGYFALLSKRNNEFPKELRLTNKLVINYLINLH